MNKNIMLSILVIVPVFGMRDVCKILAGSLIRVRSGKIEGLSAADSVSFYGSFGHKESPDRVLVANRKIFVGRMQLRQVRLVGSRFEGKAFKGRKIIYKTNSGTLAFPFDESADEGYFQRDERSPKIPIYLKVWRDTLLGHEESDEKGFFDWVAKEYGSPE